MEGGGRFGFERYRENRFGFLGKIDIYRWMEKKKKRIEEIIIDDWWMLHTYIHTCMGSLRLEGGGGLGLGLGFPRSERKRENKGKETTIR